MILKAGTYRLNDVIVPNDYNFDCYDVIQFYQTFQNSGDTVLCFFDNINGQTIVDNDIEYFVLNVSAHYKPDENSTVTLPDSILYINPVPDEYSDQLVDGYVIGFNRNIIITEDLSSDIPLCVPIIDFVLANTNYNEVNSGDDNTEGDTPEDDTPTEDTAYIEYKSWYTEVADAIRAKKGITDLISRDDFATEIESISSTESTDGAIVGVNGIWVFNDDLNISEDLEQNVNFVTKAVYADSELVWNCKGIKITADGMMYYNAFVVDVSTEYEYLDAYNENGSAENPEYKWTRDWQKTIDFGADMQFVSQEFYDWLIVKATPSGTINLAGTTLNIASGWTTEAEQGNFAITGELTIDDTTVEFLEFALGFNYGAGVGAMANYISVATLSGWQSGDNTHGFTLKITGGADVNNAGLAEWLLKNVGGEDSPLPIEVETESEMNALLESSEVGSVYKFIGTSETYETNALYIVEESEEAEDDSIIGTWIFNNTISLTGEFIYNITFTSSNDYFDTIVSDYRTSPITLTLSYVSVWGNYLYAYNVADDNEWQSIAVQTITITGGADITNETFISWLKANAVKQRG